MRSKSKCGATFCSINSAILVGLLVRRSGSSRKLFRTSLATSLTSLSGAVCACATDPTIKKSRPTKVPRPTSNLVVIADLSACSRRVRQQRLFGVAFGRLAVQELTDQLFQHDGRLRELDPVVLRQICGIAARLKADVLLAQQARGENRSGGVLRELVMIVDSDLHVGHELLLIEHDTLDPP